jgi:hypothetical protein
MTYKLIKTDNYLLVVDDSEIRDIRPFKDRWHLEDGRILNMFPDYLTDLSVCKLIIAHLPLNGSPILEGVDLLPPYSRHQEDGLEELAEMNYPMCEWAEEQCLVRRLAFMNGYNKAREKYKYTEEDVVHLLHKTARKYFQEGREYKGNMAIAGDPLHGVRRELMNMVQSLHQYPTEFECEMKYFEVDMGLGEECIEHGQIPQKITTAQGRQWVGKYK